MAKSRPFCTSQLWNFWVQASEPPLILFRDPGKFPILVWRAWCQQQRIHSQKVTPKEVPLSVSAQAALGRHGTSLGITLACPMATGSSLLVPVPGVIHTHL